MEQVNEAETDYVAVVGQRIRKLREAKKWSQEELAERANISRQSVGNVETAKKSCTLDVFFDLADSLSAAPAMLMADTGSLAYQNELAATLGGCRNDQEIYFALKMTQYAIDLLHNFKNFPKLT